MLSDKLNCMCDTVHSNVGDVMRGGQATCSSAVLQDGSSSSTETHQSRSAISPSNSAGLGTRNHSRPPQGFHYFFIDVPLINILVAVLHSTYSPSFFTYLLKLQCASLPQYAKGVPPYTTEVKHLDTVWCNITFLFAHPKINNWSFHASFF